MKGGALKEDDAGDLMNLTGAKLKYEGTPVPEAKGPNTPKLLADIQTGRLKNASLTMSFGPPMAKKLRRLPDDIRVPCSQASGPSPADGTSKRVEALDLRIKQC
jgi:hypothetical protein